MYRTLTSSSAKRTKETSIMNGDPLQHAPLLITHRREMQPLHLDDDARASSLLCVTGDLYIGGSSTGPAPVSHPTLCPTMRRDATFATVHDSTSRHRVWYSYIRGISFSCTSPRCYHHVAPACHTEEGTPAYVMSPVAPTTVDQIILLRSHISYTLSFLWLIHDGASFFLFLLKSYLSESTSWLQEKYLPSSMHRRFSELHSVPQSIRSAIAISLRHNVLYFDNPMLYVDRHHYQ